jgi:hypothetical protein
MITVCPSNPKTSDLDLGYVNTRKMYRKVNILDHL